MDLTVAASSPRAILDRSADRLLSPEVLATRVGRGTVSSEIDRTLRVRLEGTGPTSSRRLVPDSRAAAELLASPDGPPFERGMRAFLSTADAHGARDNLATVTLLPDEHAAKAVSVLTMAAVDAADGIDPKVLAKLPRAAVALLKEQLPGVTRQQLQAVGRMVMARAQVAAVTDGLRERVSFSGAWNARGHIEIMPDVSRDLLATLGLYRHKPGDAITAVRPARRPEVARDAWHTAVHEVHHSESPRGDSDAPEWTRVIEESIAEVLTPQAVHATIARAGADLERAAAPARATTGDAVPWKAWNRGHLPRPAADLASSSDARYIDGPETLRALLRLAGIDRRTTEGRAAAIDLLQGAEANRVPRRLATALAQAHGLGEDRVEQLAKLVRATAVGGASVGDVERALTAG